MRKAHKQISGENCPVKNVALNLGVSCCGIVAATLGMVSGQGQLLMAWQSLSVGFSDKQGSWL